MDEQIRAAIARLTVTGVNDSVRGTAFLVAANVVATAFHNVAEHDIQRPMQGATPTWLGPITLTFPNHPPTAAQPMQWDYDADCVLLRCDSPPPAQPLTSQSLERSGNEWNTFGFPNLQWVDGLALNGEVTFHAGELYGHQVIQLFCKQLAAGIGADAHGLSGAPVMVHNAVAALVRFALGAENRAEGGVIYACPAKFFAALDPALSVSPMRQVRPQLAEEQAQELIRFFTSRFADHRDDLETIVHYALGRELVDITQTDPARRFERIASDLLNWANQQGPGPLEALLHVATRARPQDSDLRTFCSTYVPSALQPTNVAGWIFESITALNCLTEMASASIKVRNIRVTYKDDIKVMLQQLRFVEQYKGLHNILHDIQFRMDEIEARLSAPPGDENANRMLRRYAQEISDLAEDTEQYLGGLKTRDTEKIWINSLKTQSDDMRSVAQPDAEPFDRGQVNISLRSLVGKAAVSVNGGLAEAAGDLRLVSLVSIIDAVIAQASPNAGELGHLTEGAAAIGALRVTVAEVVAQHAAWQGVSTKLETAKGTIRHQPQKKIMDWPEFEKGLRALCNLYPEEPWSKRVTARLDEWIAATQSATPTKEEKEAGKEALRLVAGSCSDRFYKVDGFVKAISEKIVQLTEPLTEFMNAEGPP
jgi:hypothetical protein